MRRSLVARLWGPGGLRLLFGDAAVVGALAIAVAAQVVPRGAGGAAISATVEADGRPAVTLDLMRDGVTEVVGRQGATRLEVRGGGVRVLSSPCARDLCRHAGWVRAPGEMLVCLPNAVVVRLRGDGTAPDALAR